MPINKVVFGNTTVINLTDSTLTQANQLVNGVTAYDRSGTKITGTYEQNVLGTKSITANGTYSASSDNLDGYSSVTVNVTSSGGGKNAQIDPGVKRTNSTTYKDVGFSITVAKTGIYDVYWTGYRTSTTGGINGVQLYINDAAYGIAVTKFDSSYANCQSGHLSNVLLSEGDVVTLRARARSSSYYMYVMNFCIIEN